jgi:protein-L-isoaspartate(D-aspartate) O-methyltransferase
MLHSKPKEDSYLQRGLRKQLVNTIREKGIKDERVLTAIEAIPRHFFLDTAFERQAYEDRAFPITAGQTISQPYTVAYQTELLEIKKFDKVLEIGTGSAYQACVLAEMGVTLYTIERQKALYDYVGQFFFIKKYPNIKRFYGDGFEGLPSFGPFDKIIITCGAPFIPPKLLEQLKPGGIMVVPVGDDGKQKMMRITKDANGTIREQEMGDFSFVPMLQGKASSNTGSFKG